MLKLIGKQRLHFRVLLLVFISLGLHVGVWATLLADIVSAVGIQPDELGFLLALQAIAGFIGLFVTGRLSKRITRQMMIALGVGGTGLFFITLAFIDEYKLLVISFLIGGLVISFFDFIVNALAGDYEKHYATKVMLPLHAGFSGGAAFAALLSGILLYYGVNYGTIYIGTGLFLLLVAFFGLISPLPTVPIIEGNSEIQKIKFKLPVIEISVLITVVFICMTFFVDSTLEGFLSIFLRDVLQSGALLGGIGLAMLYVSGMIGRLIGGRVISKIGEYNVLIISGLISIFGFCIVVLSTNPVLAISGLIFVGIGSASFVPIAFSLATRSSKNPDIAVSILTGGGYLTFIFGPLIIGQIADAYTFRTAFTLILAAQLVNVLFVVSVRSIIKRMQN